MASACKAEAARILEMPFLNEEPIEYHALTTLQGLVRLLEFNPEGLQRVLDNPQLHGGITARKAALTTLLVLEQEDPATAAAIKGLTWVQDGITYTAPSNVQSIHRSMSRYEFEAVTRMVNIAQYYPELLWLILDKPWVQDGLNGVEFDVIGDLYTMARQDETAAARVAAMPFLESFETRFPLSIMDILVDSQWPNPNNLQRLLSNPALKGGIAVDQLGVVALLDIVVRHPEVSEAVEGLAWVTDGIASSEQDDVLAMREVALESLPLFRALLSKPWMQDSLTTGERDAIVNLRFIMSQASEHRSEGDETTALRILDMPFMQDVSSMDAVALRSLFILIWDWNTHRSFLEQTLSHTALRNGITDDHTNVVAVLYKVTQNYSEMIDILLDAERTSVRERSVSLPLRGEVILSVIWPGSGGSDAQASRTMDLLEHAVRTYEEFMGMPYPQAHVIVLVSDSGSAPSGHPTSVFTLDPGHLDSGWRVARDVAYTYSTFGPGWLNDDAAEFMMQISEEARTGVPLRGEGLFLDLYRHLGDETFRQAFGNLYLLMRDDVLGHKCTEPGRGLCYLKAAFVEGLPPGKAAIAEETINRRYHGSPP